MLLSIIIVSWNAKEYLFKCLNSLIPEIVSYQSEIIIVDNASTDGSPELVRDCFPNVKLICNERNLGFAKANNIGIRESTGEYVCLVNSDIMILRNCFDSMIGFMDKHPQIGMIGPKTLNPDGTLQPSCFSFPTFWNSLCRALALDSVFPKTEVFGRRLMTFWAHDSIRSVDALNGCFLMVRREALNQVGLLDEGFFVYGEDIDWCKRFRDAEWDVVFFPKAKAIHYGGASSSNAPIRFYLEMHRADMQYWRKHHGQLGEIGFLLITWVHHIVRIVGMGTIYLIRSSKRKQVLPKIKRSVACIYWLFHASNQSRIAKDV